MLKTVDIELIGLGDRGMTALRSLLRIGEKLPVRISALRDTDVERVRAAQRTMDNGQLVRQAHHKSMVNGQWSMVDVVKLTYICTDWQSHARLAIEAMRAGRHVAVEVPAALTLEDINALVETSETTGCHCFMLENCCYDPAILDAIRRIREGEIGMPIHAEGTYYHALDGRWTPWRLEMNRHQRGDLYPTHELAPICMALGITNGQWTMDNGQCSMDNGQRSMDNGQWSMVNGQWPQDRITTLVSMDTAAFTGPSAYEQRMGTAAPDFCNGDHTTTLLRTALGRTIILRHDVLTPQPYDRLFHIVGTRGTITVRDDGSQSHSGLTQTMNERLIGALAAGKPLDFGVRDMAVWCAVTPLSELSIKRGFAPVEWPL